MSKRILSLLPLLIALLAMTTSCGNGESSLGEANPEVDADEENHSAAIRLDDDMLDTADLEVIEVGYRQMHRFINAPAKVIPNQNRDAHVGPLIEGRAGDILVNQGDRVRKGQILMYLESPQVAEAKAAYYSARAELAFAEADHERHKKLFEEKIGSEKSLLESEAAHNKAKAELEAAEKGLHAIGLTLEDVQNSEGGHETAALLPIRAPISGTVVERNVTVGQRIEPSSDVFHIVNLSELWVDADVYEKDIAHVKLGDIMEVRVPAYAEEVFRGKVIFISDVLDERTRTFKVRAALKNPDRKLKPEMYADAKIFVSEEERVLAVPVSAVLFDGQQEFVYVVEGEGAFVPRTVQTGRKGNGYVEIVAGLQPGDKIVGRGAFLVKSEAEKEAFGEGGH
jgi:cobalt-zinc-cadmium efflux system membrane fusion protein